MRVGRRGKERKKKMRRKDGRKNGEDIQRIVRGVR